MVDGRSITHFPFPPLVLRLNRSFDKVLTFVLIAFIPWILDMHHPIEHIAVYKLDVIITDLEADP